MYLHFLNILERFAFSLPSGFSLLPYLDMSAATTQVPLGVTYESTKTRIELEAECSTQNTDCGMIGVRWATNRFFFRFMETSANPDCVSVNSDFGAIIVNNVGNIYTRHKYVVTPNAFYIDGVAYQAAGTSPDSYTGGLVMPIFAYGAQPFKGKIYDKMRIYVDGVLVAEFYPARKDSTGERGLYNTIANTFVKFFNS